jgi:hypothetical protein
MALGFLTKLGKEGGLDYLSLAFFVPMADKIVRKGG